MILKGTSILSVAQFDHDDVNKLFEIAKEVRSIVKNNQPFYVLNGYIMGNLFLEPSTRSRLSFDAAFKRLGGEVINFAGVGVSSMAKGETLADTIRVLHSYCDIIVMRHPTHGAAQEAACYSTVPIINAGDGDNEHPTQALLDLYTIFEEKRKRSDLGGLTISMIGDLKFGRTAHSLAKLLTLYKGIRYIFVAPPLLQMPASLVDEIRLKGFEVVQTDDFEAGICDSDIVYMTRMQKERFIGKKEGSFETEFILTRKIVENVCKPDVTVMHPLPRTSEIAVDVDEMPNAAYFRQAQNGLLIRIALFLLILGKSI